MSRESKAELSLIATIRLSVGSLGVQAFVYSLQHAYEYGRYMECGVLKPCLECERWMCYLEPVFLVFWRGLHRNGVNLQESGSMGVICCAPELLVYSLWVSRCWVWGGFGLLRERIIGEVVRSVEV